MKIKLASVSIDDYDKALKFYTEILGFILKRDIPLGNDARWITVVSPDDPNGVELVLEPNASYPAMKALKESLV
ncbi:MAG TPA: VOC family protein, partial [Anaerolineales bacterium]|nr:VOC family protein [Anaerolineales bacterium]HNE04317.1 VOC family protein [Anaerolineales bacterium]